MKARTLVGILQYVVGLGLLAYMISSNWTGIKVVLSKPMRLEYLALAALVAAVALLVTFLRWHYLVRAVGLPFTRYNSLRLGLVGYFFNTFLPGSVGGDLLKAVYIAREQMKRTRAVATIIADRIIGLWALVAFVVVLGGGMWIMGDPLVRDNADLFGIVRVCGIIVLSTGLFWIIIGFLPDRRADHLTGVLRKVPKIGSKLSELWWACWLYRKRPVAVGVATLMSLVGHVGWVLVFQFVVMTFFSDPAEVGSFGEHLIIVPVGMTAQALTPLPGGIGGGEAAYGKLYEMLGKDHAIGVFLCFAQRMVFWGLALIGWLIYLRMKAELPSADIKSAAETAPLATESDLQAAQTKIPSE